jgi:hypothetical protein
MKLPLKKLTMDQDKHKTNTEIITNNLSQSNR